MAQQKLSQNLKDTILELVSDLKDNVFTREDEIGDLMLVEFFFKRMHHESIMNRVIDKVLPWKHQIENRSQEFFLKNTSLFEGLPKERISHYTTAISKGDRFDETDNEVVWQYFDTIIKLAETYKKNK